jgi:NADH-quinone oxidoreductase subunit L
MFLAMGVSAYSAAMFHFMTHAFFKALLFLGAGVVILAVHHEHDMFKMGGLRKKLPVTFWTFLIGCASLAAVPLITSGFYSKDLILWLAWTSPSGSPVLWLVGMIGALLTAVYTFRMLFLTFYGPVNTETSFVPGHSLRVPLIVLAVLATIGGFVKMPHTLGGFQPFSQFLGQVIPAVDAHASLSTELLFQLIAAVVSLGGIYIAYVLYRKRRDRLTAVQSYPLPGTLDRYFYGGLGFDWIYDRLIVTPYTWAARISRNDVIDYFYTGLAWISLLLSRLFSKTQNGKLRSYAYAVSLGAVVIIVVVVIA